MDPKPHDEDLHRGWMRTALDEGAAGLAEGELPIGAVLVQNGHIVARAHWSRAADDLLAHPELLVLRQAGEPGGVLVSTLEPCLMCMGAAMSSFVSTVVFAISSPTDGAAAIPAQYADRLPREGGRPWSIPRVVGGVLGAESQDLIRRFIDSGGCSPMHRWAQTLLPA